MVARPQLRKRTRVIGRPLRGPHRASRTTCLAGRALDPLSCGPLVACLDAHINYCYVSPRISLLDENASMQLSRLFFALALLLAPVALVGTTWLYLYPLFSAACAFPRPPAFFGAAAPFRLLALGDPQLEGNTALFKARANVFASFDNLASHIRDADSLLAKCRLVRDAVRHVPRDVLRALEGYVQKPLDIWGNDLYLAHIVRTLRWWSAPSHVAVLGDLLGSQWIGDGEFEARSGRYWGRVFGGMERVPERVMTGYTDADEGYQESEGEEEAGQEKEEQREKRWGGTTEVLGADPAWSSRLINIAGNHDIGYAGDIDAARIARFERVYGHVNWDIVFTLPNTSSSSTTASTSPPALRLVILNTMNLDTPAFDPVLQHDTYAFVNHIVSTSRSVTDKTHATILLTHIPLHKEAGICVDAPLFDFFPESSGGGVKEQNMLSEYASKVVLESIFGLSGHAEAEGKGFGRRGLVVNGHDHAGCDVLHWTTQIGGERACKEDGDEEASGSAHVLDEGLDAFVANDTRPIPDTSLPPPEPKWRATPYPHRSACPSLREITLRSMMGEFEGYAGFVSAWFDEGRGERGEWVVEASTCGLGVQHWWWGVHVVDVLLLVSIVAGALISTVEGTVGEKEKSWQCRRCWKWGEKGCCKIDR